MRSAHEDYGWTMETRRQMKPSEAARILRCCYKTVIRYIVAGKLPAVRRGGTHYLIDERDVLRLLTPAVEARPKHRAGTWTKAREARTRLILEGAGLA
jgi:excisionase family DNA binding protein